MGYRESRTPEFLAKAIRIDYARIPVAPTLADDEDPVPE